jgi:hypothetical protein
LEASGGWGYLWQFERRAGFGEVPEELDQNEGAKLIV